MTDQETLTPTRPRPLPGTGRLGVVAAYFTVAGLGTGLTTVFAAKALLVSAWRGAFAANAASVGLLCGVLTFGYLRTDRLLSQRLKSGGFAALLCLSGTIASTFFTGGNRWMAGVALVGLGLLASVWRHLE